MEKETAPHIGKCSRMPHRGGRVSDEYAWCIFVNRSMVSRSWREKVKLPPWIARRRLDDQLNIDPAGAAKSAPVLSGLDKESPAFWRFGLRKTGKWSA
jgi:hypothetical protein